MEEDSIELESAAATDGADVVATIAEDSGENDEERFRPRGLCVFNHYMAFTLEQRRPTTLSIALQINSKSVNSAALLKHRSLLIWLALTESKQL